MGWTFSEVASSSTGITTNDVIWADSLGLFVAVGNSGLVLTSPTGQTWTKRTAASAVNWMGVAWNGTVLAAVASSGASRVMTSPDGVTWTSRTAAHANTWWSVCWADSLGLFVAVSNNNSGSDNAQQVMTSPDGITWTGQAPASFGTWNAVAWSEDSGLLVARQGAGVASVMTSTDAVTWTGQATDANWQPVGGALAWLPSAALFAGPIRNGATTDYGVLTSPDGVTWTEQSIPNPSTFVDDIVAASSKNRFVLHRTTSILESSDGVTWTETSTGFSTLSVASAWSDSLNLYVSPSTSAEQIVLLGSLVPVVDAVNPDRGTKRGGTVCTLTGSGLEGISVVTFGGTAATDVVPAADGLSLTCISPAHEVGPVAVAVS